MPTLPIDVTEEVIPRLAAAKRLMARPPEGVDEREILDAVALLVSRALYYLDAA